MAVSQKHGQLRPHHPYFYQLHGILWVDPQGNSKRIQQFHIILEHNINLPHNILRGILPIDIHTLRVDIQEVGKEDNRHTELGQAVRIRQSEEEFRVHLVL